MENDKYRPTCQECSFRTGIGIVINDPRFKGIEFKPGDRVCTSLHNHPYVNHPFIIKDDYPACGSFDSIMNSQSKK